MLTLRKPTKTISGVTPLAVMLPPRKCKHGACLYCPSLNAPQSYTPKSPAVLRASALGYDTYQQVIQRLKSFQLMGHPTDKIELIIMGGTFLNFPEKFQDKLILDCYNALNQKTSKTLEEAKKINETAQHRCIAMCIETRPDFCSDKHIAKMLAWGVTRVELGVQNPDDKIYKFINRGHSVQDVINATERLKKAGFKLGYHLMPGLPLSTPRKDIEMYKKIFSNENFKPDQVKIYPCQVLQGAGLEKLYYRGKYKPYNEKELTELLVKLLELTPEYCRVMRIMREIPENYLVSGVKNIGLRSSLEETIRQKKLKIQEIRFREIGFALRDNRKIKSEIKVKILEYQASHGKEYFIQAVNKDNILFGLLRLRIDNNQAIIRELHVYGPETILGKVEAEKFQHKGLGKLLMQKAEELAGKERKNLLRVISGVGVREYYRKLGYEIDSNGIYMEKYLSEIISQEKVWDKLSESWKRFKDKPFADVKEFLKAQKGNILDLGCGSGRHIIRTKGKMYGIDFSEEMLKHAKQKIKKQKLNAEVIKANLEKLPFQNNFFNSAIYIASLHCIESSSGRKKSLKELYRVLKPKSQVLISVWSRNSERVKNKPKETLIPWTVDAKKYFRYYYVYDKKEFEDLLKSTGFKILDIKEGKNITAVVEKT